MSLTGGSYGKEPGFDAIRGKYGEEMVQRMKNWPYLAAVYCEASGGDELMVGRAKGEGYRDVERARVDKAFALDQADRIAAKVPRHQWSVMPTVLSLQSDWGFLPPVPDGAKVRSSHLELVHQPELGEET